MSITVTGRTWTVDKTTTTDGSATTIETIAVPSSTTMLIEARVVARRTGGTSGSAEDGAGYVVSATYKNVGGTATLIGSTVVAHEDQAGWDVTFSASSGNALIQVTGAANNNVSWRIEYRLSLISSA